MNDQEANRSFSLIIYFAATLWAVEVVNFVTGHEFIRWGILPRTVKGLMGIPLNPFIHTGIMHLILNTGPIVILGGLICWRGKWIFLEKTFFIILVGGLGLWIIGRSSYHVGASGLMFGYFGYLVSRGILEKSFSSLIVSLITVFAYGGLIWGLLPTYSWISWEGHFCGFVAGIVAARFERSRT